MCSHFDDCGICIHIKKLHSASALAAPTAMLQHMVLLCILGQVITEQSNMTEILLKTCQEFA